MELFVNQSLEMCATQKVVDDGAMDVLTSLTSIVILDLDPLPTDEELSKAIDCLFKAATFFKRENGDTQLIHPGRKHFISTRNESSDNDNF
ncbi:hypothetical protein ElyMa_000339500 [Elysia marginata]|uniref:Uncharacterized protein n=1 Tax=Elysia marginata TaxID=1093978 RepID=A0AAV4FCA9_9GAST|nr:hypothetical protein ElyMa_000339500 [Elysia marginata]